MPNVHDDDEESLWFADEQETAGRRSPGRTVPASGGGIRVAVTVVIEMTREQKDAYAAAYGIGDGVTVRAKDIVEDVRSYVHHAIGESPAFGEVGDGNGTRAATVTLK